MEFTPKDILWKGVIEDLGPSFVNYFFPHISPKINQDKTFQYLDAELASLYPDGKTNNRRADKLIQVYTKNGSSIFVLIHVEIQGYNDPEFGKRMFQMGIRVYEKYGQLPYVLVIYTNTSPNYQPDTFKLLNESTELIYRFQTYVVKEESLPKIKTKNPFDLVLKTAKYEFGRKKRSDEQLLILKIKLLQEVLLLSLADKEQDAIMNFLRHYLRFESSIYLNKFEEIVNQNGRKPMGIREAILKYTEERGIEKGIEKGVEAGIEKGLKQGIKKQLVTAVKNMINSNLTHKEIMLYLGIEQDQLEEILMSIKRKELE